MNRKWKKVSVLHKKLDSLFDEDTDLLLSDGQNNRRLEIREERIVIIRILNEILGEKKINKPTMEDLRSKSKEIIKQSLL